MKYIIAVVQPNRLPRVMEALEEEEIHLLTASEVPGGGRQKGVTQIYCSHVEPGNLLRKVKIEIAVSDTRVWQTVDAIRLGPHTGDIGDGKVFVLDLEECIRIRTGETGEFALT